MKNSQVSVTTGDQPFNTHHEGVFYIIDESIHPMFGLFVVVLVNVINKYTRT